MAELVTSEASLRPHFCALCMTATSSIQISSKIMKLLNMTNAKLIRHSPDKKNVSYHVQKAADLDETFQWMLNLVSSPVTEILKSIIYCHSLKDCGEIHSLFEAAANSEMPVVTVYHSKTPGRDGKPCKATLYYRPFHLAHCDEHMRNFLKNTEGKCRREILMNYFKEKPDTPDLKHDCCDIVRQPANAIIAAQPKHLTLLQ